MFQLTPHEPNKSFVPKAISSLRITNATASTRIACEASNAVITGNIKTMKEFRLQVTNIPSPNQDDDLKFREPPTGQCAYYNGKICKYVELSLKIPTFSLTFDFEKFEIW